MLETPSHELAPAPRTRTRELQTDELTTRATVKDLIGCILNDRYELIARIKRGGMGTVYLARHVAIGKRVAVKILSPQYAAQRDVVRRFLQEARATSELRHSHIVDVSDFGHLTSGEAYLVMEYLEGEDLAETVRRDGPLPWLRVASMLLQVCAALEAAHGCGIVHRDIKPSNCFRVYHAGDPDFVKLLDFGIAKVLGSAQSDDYPVTATGAILGTLDYMAPELFGSGSVDPRVDIYAVGMLAYKLLTDTLPFAGTTHEKVAKIVQGDLLRPSVRAPHVPLAPGVEATIMRALHHDPDQRFPTIQALAAALLTQLHVPPPTAATILKSGSVAALAPYINNPPRDDDENTSVHLRASTRQPALAANDPPPAPPARPRRSLLWICGGSVTGAVLAFLYAHYTHPLEPPPSAPVVRAAVESPPARAEPPTHESPPDPIPEHSAIEVIVPTTPAAQPTPPKPRRPAPRRRTAPSQPSPTPSPTATEPEPESKRATFLDPTTPPALLRPEPAPAQPAAFLTPRTP